MERRLSMAVKREISRKYAAEYGRLPKKEKSRVIDHLCATCGWTRKHAIKALSKARAAPAKGAAAPVRRKRKYGSDLVPIVERIWYASGFQNAKSLHALMGVWYDRMKRFGELDGLGVTLGQERLLLEMSASTLGRMLMPARDALRLKGHASTKAGALLRNSIKVRRAGDEQERAPGFIELDTVAHCGASLKGEFIRSITATDVLTGWTENAAVRNNAHSNIVKGLVRIEDAFPYPLEGFDCDNGSEFINKAVVKWVSDRDLYFTRSRPYKKNDNAHVEQKNNDMVRRLAFYYRYDTPEELRLLNAIYGKASLFYNLFRAVQKADGYRESGAGRKVRTYDAPKTPYQRSLDAGAIPEGKAGGLAKLYESTNPAALMREIVALQGKLIELAEGPTDDAARHEMLVNKLLEVA